MLGLVGLLAGLLLMRAWSAFGAGQDHASGAGIMEANEQLIFTPFPCHCRQLPVICGEICQPDRGLPARHPQRGADRALPAGTSRTARPSRPIGPQSQDPAGTVTGGNYPEPGAPAATECDRPSLRARMSTRRAFTELAGAPASYASEWM